MIYIYALHIHAGTYHTCLYLALVCAVEEMMELATETFDFDLQRVFDECSPADFANRTAVKLVED